MYTLEELQARIHEAERALGFMKILEGKDKITDELIAIQQKRVDELKESQQRLLTILERIENRESE